MRGARTEIALKFGANLAVLRTLLGLGVRSAARHRGALVASLIADPLVQLVNIFLFSAVYRRHGQDEILGYRVSQMIWYFIGANLVSCWIFNFTDRRLADRIANDDLIGDLLRPVSIFTWELGAAASGRVFAVVAEFIPSLAIYSAVIRPDFLTITGALRFMLAACIAFALLFMINFLVGISRFYLRDIRPLQAINHLVVGLAGGAFIPLDFFPDRARAVLGLLPFAYIFYWPIQFLLGRPGASCWPAFASREAAAVGWLAVLAVACAVAWRWVIRRYTGAQAGVA